MAGDSFLLMKDARHAGVAEEVGEAVEALSLLADLHFFHAGSREISAGWWVHQWQMPDSGQRIDLHEMLEVPLAWVVVHAGSEDQRAAIHAGLRQVLTLRDPEELLARAQAEPGDPSTMKRLGIGGDVRDPRVLAALEQALRSPDGALRRAVAEATVVRRPRPLAPSLRAAAKREDDARLAQALRFAADCCETDEGA